jgi:hypothetical protein
MKVFIVNSDNFDFQLDAFELFGKTQSLIEKKGFKVTNPIVIYNLKNSISKKKEILKRFLEADAIYILQNVNNIHTNSFVKLAADLNLYILQGLLLEEDEERYEIEKNKTAAPAYK